MLEFQIVTKTEHEAEVFMDEVRAEDVSIEDWSGVYLGERYERYVCGFGMARGPKKALNEIADSLGVSLIYAKAAELGNA